MAGERKVKLKIEIDGKDVPATEKSLDRLGDASKKNAEKIKTSFSEVLKGSFFGSLAANIVSSFTSKLAEIPGKVKDIIDDAVQIAQDRANAFKGLESISLFKGAKPQDVQESVKGLRLVKAGILDVTDAASGMKNLLQAGFSQEQAVKVLERFSDAAAFGKQSALSFGEAISRAAEGIKNQNSELVDNVGLTKNLSVILKERGFELEDLTDKTKAQSAVNALYNGILEETKAQVGDADKLTNSYTGSVAALDQAQKDLLATGGELITQSPQMTEANKVLTEQIQNYTKGVKDADSETGKFARQSISRYAELKGSAISLAASIVEAFKLAGYTVVTAVSGLLVSLTTIVEGALAPIRYAIYTVQKGLVDLNNFAYDNIPQGALAAAGLGSFGLTRVEVPVEPDYMKYTKRAVDMTIKFADALKQSYNNLRAYDAEFQKSRERIRNAPEVINIAPEQFDDKGNKFFYGKDKSTLTPITGGGSSSRKSSVRDILKPSPQAQAIIDAARKLGVSPIDLASIISFETGGTFNPNKVGGENNKFRGLIQFGPEEQKQFGVFKGQSFEDQITNSVVNYFKQRFASVGRRTEGASLLDLYTTVIAGNPNANKDARDAFGTSARSGTARIIAEHRPKVISKFFKGRLPEDFGESERIEAETRAMLDRANQLSKAKEKILEITKELGLSENNYAVTSIEQADATIKRLDLIADLQKDWTNEIERTKQEIFNIQNSDLSEGDKLQVTFEEWAKKAGLTADEIAVLNTKLQELKKSIAELDAAKKKAAEVQKIVELAKEAAQIDDERRANRASSADDLLKSLKIDLSNGGRNLTVLEQTIQRVNELEAAYGKLDEAKRSEILATAAQIDAQNRLREQYEETRATLLDIFEILTEEGKSFGERFTNVFKYIADRFKQMLLQMAADWVTSKIFGGGGQSSNSGGFGNVFGGIFGGGNSSSSGGFGTIFGGNAGGGIFNFSGSSSSGSSHESGFAIPNFSTNAGTKNVFSNFLGKGGIFGDKGFGLNAGTLSGIGALASLGGGLIGGRAGSFISNIGSGLAIGAQIGSIIPGIGTVVGAVIGAGIGFLASLFGGDPKKKRDKKEKLPQLNKGFSDALNQLKQLLADVRQLKVDPDSAISQASDIRAQIASGFGIQFESKKYRKQAQTLIRGKLSEADVIIGDIKKAAEIARGAADRNQRILPEFASGNYFADFFKPNGLIPGIFDRKDDILAYISRGEMVLNPSQINRVKAITGFDPFAYANIPNYPSKPRTPKFASGANFSSGAAAAPSIIQPNLTLVVEGVAIGDEITAYLESDTGVRTQIKVQKKLKSRKDL